MKMIYLKNKKNKIELPNIQQFIQQTTINMAAKDTTSIKDYLTNVMASGSETLSEGDYVIMCNKMKEVFELCKKDTETPEQYEPNEDGFISIRGTECLLKPGKAWCKELIKLSVKCPLTEADRRNLSNKEVDMNITFLSKLFQGFKIKTSSTVWVFDGLSQLKEEDDGDALRIISLEFDDIYGSGTKLIELVFTNDTFSQFDETQGWAVFGRIVKPVLNSLMPI